MFLPEARDVTVGVSAIPARVSMQPPMSRPVTSTGPLPGTSQDLYPTCFQVVARGSSSKPQKPQTSPESDWVTGPAELTTSSQ